jgi:hypothetical protein
MIAMEKKSPKRAAQIKKVAQRAQREFLIWQKEYEKYTKKRITKIKNILTRNGKAG